MPEMPAPTISTSWSTGAAAAPLARALERGRVVVGEGLVDVGHTECLGAIEEAEQLAFLRAHGCDFYQGYYCSKPLPADEFEVLVRSKL